MGVDYRSTVGWGFAIPEEDLESGKIKRSTKTDRWVVRGGTVSSIAGGKSVAQSKPTKSSTATTMRIVESRVGKSRFAQLPTLTAVSSHICRRSFILCSFTFSSPPRRDNSLGRRA